MSAVFPEPFGLERYRLRLKSGASEKLKLSFLPFVMPAAAAAPATSPSKGRKPSKGSGADSGTAEPPRVRSLLVLKDSDCGEFTYELVGEVGQPSTFLQHETKVGLDGTQVGIAIGAGCVDLSVQLTTRCAASCTCIGVGWTHDLRDLADAQDPRSRHQCHVHSCFCSHPACIWHMCCSAMQDCLCNACMRV